MDVNIPFSLPLKMCIIALLSSEHLLLIDNILHRVFDSPWQTGLRFNNYCLTSECLLIFDNY